MTEKTLNNEAQQRIFDARAKELAKVLDEERHSQEAGNSFLIFYLGAGKDEKYALSYQHVERVIPLQRLTEIPSVSNLFLGITYYNTQVWPVIDTEILFEFSTDKMHPEYVVLVREGSYRYALAVRRVLGHQYLDVTKGLIKLSGKTEKNHYILGVCQSDISVIDDKAVFSYINQLSLGE